MKTRLLYFNHCGVDAKGELNPFARQELPFLAAHFDEVIMLTLHGAYLINPADPLMPTLQKMPFVSLLALAKLWFDPNLWREVLHLKRDHRLNLPSFLKLIKFTKRAQQMALLAKVAPHTTLYSFWMSADAYAAALIHQKHPSCPFIARGHAFDIYLDRNAMNPYLMKSFIAAQADHLYPISHRGETQMLSYMAYAKEKISPLAMGSVGKPVATIAPPPLHQSGVFSLVSCAKVIPIKQVHRIVEALALWEGCPIHWTHMGGGAGEEALLSLAMEKLDQKENILYDFLGDCTHDEVQARYEHTPFDAFINVSQMEGVPVSIMEAMRFGIPAIAPDVGGISELVTKDVGVLFAQEEYTKGIVNALHTLTALSASQTDQMRQNAKQRWEQHFQSETLLAQLFVKG